MGACLSNTVQTRTIGNDYSYNLVFKRQIEAICRKGDAVAGLSTSGNSKNVILAMEEASKSGTKAISFTGDCRKPEVGIGVKSVQKYGLNPKACYIVGNHDKDIRLGRISG